MARKPCILFVDDEVSVLDGLRRAMSRHESRWEMRFSNLPAKALDLFRSAVFDVVVSDMKMPGTNGVDLVLAMRRIRNSSSFIILTGNADLSVAIDAINRAEIFRFFTKPCEADQLAEGIEAALKANRLKQPGQALGEAALDTFAAGLLMVDGNGQVLFMNRRGGELCALGDGISIGPDGVCRASSTAETSRLHALIRSATTGGNGGVLSLERPIAEMPLTVAIAAAPSVENSTVVAIYISDPDDTRIPASEQLGAMFGLTPAEAHIVFSLSQGFSLAEAAALSGITVGTARNYLKQIFLKTGTSRQAELIRLVFSRNSPFQ